MAKPARKSVSFQMLENGGNEPTSKSEVSIPKLKTSPLVLPFHVPLVLWGMFRDGLTENVRNALLRGLANLIALQFAYGFLLQLQVISKKKKSDGKNPLLRVLMATFGSLLLTNPIFVTMVLLGAPLYMGKIETYILSFHFALIIFQPLLICYDFNFKKFMELRELEDVPKAVISHPILAGCSLTIVGAWLGTLPIPLDWDRPWQQWPITIMVGGYIGAFVGPLVGLTISVLTGQ